MEEIKSTELTMGKEKKLSLETLVEKGVGADQEIIPNLSNETEGVPTSSTPPLSTLNRQRKKKKLVLPLIRLL